MLLLNSQDDLTTKDAPISVVDFETQVTTTRAGGVLSNFITVSKDTLAKLGALGNDLVGPLFIILEFVAKSWKMAGIGAINIAATVAAGFAASGPVGWFVDAAIAIFFFSELHISESQMSLTKPSSTRSFRKRRPTS